MPRDKKCIIFAVNALMGGGAERVAVDIANRCRLDDMAVILLLSREEGPYLKQVADHVKILSVGVSLGITDTFRFSKRLKTLLEGLDPVVVVSHLTAMNRMLLRCRKLGAFDAPVAVVEHNNIELQVGKRSGIKGWLLKRELAWLYPTVSSFVGVSAGVVDSVVKATGISRSLGRVIYNPVDVNYIQHMASIPSKDAFAEQWHSLPRPIVISAGRLHPQKGFEDLVSTFGALPERSRGSLIILGEGPLEGKLRDKARAIGIADRVHFPGFVANPWWYMQQSDLFVLSSHWEGFGLVIAEAMACGLPIISTDCPYGPSEIIEDGVSGNLVPVGDTRLLSKKMHDCLDSGELQERFRSAGFERVKAFMPEVALEKYLSLIRDCGN